MKTTETGIIESISPQGDMLYATIRRVGDTATDVDNNIVKINTTLFNRHGIDIPENKYVLAEILIPLDVMVEFVNIKYEKLIGKTVLVTLDGGKALYASVLDTSSEARTIAAEDIMKARKLSRSMTKIDAAGVKFLEKSGYAINEILTVLSEEVAEISIDGKVLRYGDAATHDTVSKSENSSRYDMKQSISVATNIPPFSAKNKTCHIHIRPFSAK
jgi:hypothetical protein